MNVSDPKLQTAAPHEKHPEDYYTDSVAQVEKLAASRGCIVTYPKPNELFVDIDCEKDLAIFHSHIFKLEGRVVSFTVNPSPSGEPGHYHARVTMGKDLGDLERVCLQTLLGSDRLHELLSWLRIERKSPAVTVLFEKPEVAK